MKGEVQGDPIVLNKWLFEVDGLPPFYARKAGPFDKELTEAEAPDTTKHSAGRSLASECSVETPMHHDAEYAALEAWFRDCEHAVTGYKRQATVTFQTAEGVARRVYVLEGFWLKKRALPEADRTSDDLGFATWTCPYDDVITIQ